MAVSGKLLSSLKRASILDNWSNARRFLSQVLPLRCRLCGVPAVDLPLCTACRADLPWRAHTPHTGSHHVRLLHSSFRYEFPIRQLIAGAKFKRDVGTAALLGSLMAQRPPPGLGLPDLLCPVPIPNRRLIWRGFNQALELSRPIARACAIPIRDELIRRIGWQPPQMGLTALERRRNLRHAFAIAGDVAGAHVVLIDDVLTTGATVLTLARLLRRAGAGPVDVWTCAMA